MPRSSSARQAAPAPSGAAAARARQWIPLCDIDIARENLRAGEPPDDEIPLLAETLLAAGQLQPITVRPGRRKERPFMALDGRRRLLALRLLAGQERIGDVFLVDVFVETDPARQAAAAVLTNTAVPVHVADVISAIGRMLKSKLGVPVIARALGHAEIDVKRLAALSALPEAALEALRAGRMNLRQAKLLARLRDPAEQAELAESALNGHGFPDWRIAEKLDEGQVSAKDARCALVPPDRYVEAGGRVEADLFGERAPVLLDPPLLTELWTARASGIASVFEAEGLSVHIAPGGEIALPADLKAPGYIYGGMLPAEEMARYREARAAQEAASEAVHAMLEQGAEARDQDAAVVAMVRAAVVRDQIALGGRVATDLVFSPSHRYGLIADVYAPVEPDIVRAPSDPSDPSDLTQADVPQTGGPAVFVAPRAEAPEPEVEGLSHGLHALRTDVATRGLIRALADDPRTALTALISRLFAVVASRGHEPRSHSALTVSAEVFSPKGGRVIPSLDGVVRQRLDARRAAWEASGLTLICWVHELEDADRLAFLADLTALTLDVREERTSLIRGAARAEACELAELSGARITRHWTPDTAFLAAHSKPMLVAMLEAMGKAAPSGAAPAKADLVTLVEATAAARNWAPPALSWTAPEDEGPEPARAEEDDGAGAFEVTPQGEAALAHAAE